jgi:hypothetical protein
VSDTEVLEVGGDRPAGPSRRVVLTVVGVGLVIGVIGFLVDRSVRAQEQAAVTRCAAAVESSVDMTSRRVRAAYEYVRPSLGLALRPELEAGIFRTIAKAAEGADAGLAEPRTTCTEFSVFPLHDRLQERRDRCVDVLDAHRSGLAAVAMDGKALREWIDLPRAC